MLHVDIFYCHYINRSTRTPKCSVKVHVPVAFTRHIQGHSVWTFIRSSSAKYYVYYESTAKEGPVNAIQLR